MYVQGLDTVSSPLLPHLPTRGASLLLDSGEGECMLAMPRWPLSVTDEAEDQGVHSKGGSCLTHAQEGALSGCLSASFL